MDLSVRALSSFSSVSALLYDSITYIKTYYLNKLLLSQQTKHVL